MSRFDYVRYDEKRAALQSKFKEIVTELEIFIEDDIESKRAKKLALTALEVCYMWIGKGLRDDQVVANGSAELMEERGED